MPVSLWRYYYKKCGFEYLPQTQEAQQVQQAEAEAQAAEA